MSTPKEHRKTFGGDIVKRKESAGKGGYQEGTITGTAPSGRDYHRRSAVRKISCREQKRAR